MPKITYLKEFEGALWARLELDVAVADGPVHVYTEKEIKDLEAKIRKSVWDEIHNATDRWDD
jgi:hypothetical protein